MRTAALNSVFQVQASDDVKRLLQDFETSDPELVDIMRAEIRRKVSLESEALARKYPDPKMRIVYRLIHARELRLMAVLSDNRLLEESVYACIK